MQNFRNTIYIIPLYVSGEELEEFKYPLLREWISKTADLFFGCATLTKPQHSVKKKISFTTKSLV